MGEKNNGILEKTSPNSPFIIHHSSFIIRHSSYPLSPFFQTAKLLQEIKKWGREKKNNLVAAFNSEWKELSDGWI